MESTLTSVKMYLKFFYDDGEWVDKPVVYFAGISDGAFFVNTDR